MLILLFSLLLSAEAQSMDRPPVHSYWHIYTDSEGVSRLKKCELQNFKAKSTPEGAEKLWVDELNDKASTVSVITQPPSWQGMWHEEPGPEWIVTLSGRWYANTMDGQKVEMGPGEIVFGEDQNTKADGRGYRGHLAGTIGAEPTTLMIIKTNLRPVANAPCRLK